MICNSFARSGLVQTRDGKTHQGELSFTNHAVQISNSLEVTAIPRAEITRVSFDTETVPPSSEFKGEGLGLLGYYFANTNVLGPVQVRLDPTIDFDWSTGEPITGVGKDYFAVIWMGHLEAPASGEFTFTVIADDRARLQIGSNLVIEAVRREQQEESSGKLQLEQGTRYPITLLYQDVMGDAKLRLLWSGPDLPKSPIPPDRLYPASFVIEHAADIQSGRGLLATSYEKSDFSGNTSTRVVTTVEPNSTSNLTRWTGQLRADYSEPYIFYVATEGPVRLRLDGKSLIDKWNHEGLAEIKAGTRLNAGQTYAIELETMLPIRLLWSSPSQVKCVIPQSHLTPLARRTQIPSPTGPEAMIPPGLLLRNGSFVATRVESIEEDIVQCSRLLNGKRIPLSEVARIVWQPLSRDLASRVTSDRPGVLLANGDFVEGTFVRTEGTQVTISSVLLGLRTYNTTQQAVAVILGEADGIPSRYEVRLRDQSVLFTSHLDMQPGGVVFADKLFAGLRVGEDQITAVQIR